MTAEPNLLAREVHPLARTFRAKTPVVPVRFPGWGFAVPDRVVTNADLEVRLDTSDAWITTRTGIAERRVTGAGATTEELAVAAGRRAIERAGVAAGEVDLVIVATTTPDRACPGVAPTVQAALGTAGAAFDLNGACSGFVHALHVAMGLLATGPLGLVLVIGADRFTSLLDPEDRATVVLFGDGAGAVLTGPAEDVAAGDLEPGLLGIDLGGDGTAAAALAVPPGDRYVRMDGREVYRRATRAMTASCAAALDRAGLSADDVELFVPHQANARIITATAERLGLPPERVVVNVDRYGNTSAASVPIALAEAADAGRLHPGHVVLLSAVGAGMGWASLVLRWQP